MKLTLSMRYFLIALPLLATTITGTTVGAKPVDLLTQLRMDYPKQIAEFEAQCPLQELDLKEVTQATTQSKRARFVCWSLKSASGDRTGQIIGQLPLVKGDQTFVKPVICRPGDPKCPASLQKMRLQYAVQFSEAEFQCGTKNGSLFFAYVTPATLDLRCRFFVTQLFDPQGDGQNISESYTSAEISLGTFNLRDTGKQPKKDQ